MDDQLLLLFQSSIVGVVVTSTMEKPYYYDWTAVVDNDMEIPTGERAVVAVDNDTVGVVYAVMSTA